MNLNHSLPAAVDLGTTTPVPVAFQGNESAGGRELVSFSRSLLRSRMV